MAYSREEIVRVVQGATASGEYFLNVPPKSVVERVAGMIFDRSRPTEGGVMYSRFLGIGKAVFFIREGVRTVINPDYEPKMGTWVLKWPWEQLVPGYDLRQFVDVGGTSAVKPEIEQLGNVSVTLGMRVAVRKPLRLVNLGLFPQETLEKIPDLRKVDVQGNTVDTDPYHAIARTPSSVLDNVVALTAIEGRDEIGEISRDKTKAKTQVIQDISAYFQDALKSGMGVIIPELMGMESNQAFFSVEVAISPTTRQVLEAEAQADMTRVQGGARADVAGMTAGKITEGVAGGIVDALQKLIPLFIAGKKGRRSKKNE